MRNNIKIAASHGRGRRFDHDSSWTDGVRRS